jgi:hypothetical protein
MYSCWTQNNLVVKAEGVHVDGVPRQATLLPGDLVSAATLLVKVIGEDGRLQAHTPV